MGFTDSARAILKSNRSLQKKGRSSVYLNKKFKQKLKLNPKMKIGVTIEQEQVWEQQRKIKIAKKIFILGIVAIILLIWIFKE